MVEAVSVDVIRRFITELGIDFARDLPVEVTIGSIGVRVVCMAKDPVNGKPFTIQNEAGYPVLGTEAKIIPTTESAHG